MTSLNRSPGRYEARALVRFGTTAGQSLHFPVPRQRRSGKFPPLPDITDFPK
jgi:hypothetical protein